MPETAVRGVSPVRDGVLTRYLAARTLSNAGSGLTNVALPLAAYTIRGSAADVGAVAAAGLVPYLVTMPLAGVVADRFSRRTMMVAADSVAALSLASIPVAALLGNVMWWHLLVVAALSGTCTVLFDAANLAAMPVIFPGDRLAPATGVVSTGTAIADMAGPLAAGGLLAVASPPTALALDAVTFVVSATLVLSLRAEFEEAPGRRREPLSPRAAWRDLRSALAFIAGQPRILAVTGAAAGMSLSGGAVLGLLAVYASTSFHGDHGFELGTLMAGVSGGGIAVTALLSRILRRLSEGAVMLAGLVANLASGLALAASAWFPLSLVMITCYGASFALVTVNAIMIRQRLTPDAMRGRVLILGRMLASTGARVVGVGLVGALIPAITVRPAYAVMMAGTAAAILIAALSGITRMDFRGT